MRISDWSSDVCSSDLDVVRAHAHLDVQVARRRARRAGLALAGKAEEGAAVDAGRHLHRQDLFLLHAARAAAFRTRAAEGLAATVALRARLLHREDAALEDRKSTRGKGSNECQMTIPSFSCIINIFIY